MLDRRHNVLEDTEIVEAPNGHSRVVSEAETASCTCPELCIRDHEHE